MRVYDYKKAKKIITGRQNIIKKASLGIKEDWFYTGETVFEKGVFVVDLNNKNLEIQGMQGSSWGTPVLCLETINGGEYYIRIYTGDTEKTKPILKLGILSAETQNYVDMFDIISPKDWENLLFS